MVERVAVERKSDSELLLELFDYMWVIEGRLHLEHHLMPESLEQEMQARRMEMGAEQKAGLGNG